MSNAPSLESLRERFGARYKWIALASMFFVAMAPLFALAAMAAWRMQPREP